MNISTLWLRNSALAAAATSAIAAFNVYAQMPDMPPPDGKPMHEHVGMHHKDRAEQPQKRLAELETALKLQPTQQAAWNDYKAFVQQQQADRESTMKRHHEEMRAQGTLPAPERLKKMSQHMKEMSDKLALAADKTGTFYAVLSPEQKKTFDDLSAKRPGRLDGPGPKGPTGKGPADNRQPPASPNRQ